MNKYILFSLLFVIFAPLLQAQLEGARSRTWTKKNGKKARATLSKIEGKEIVLKLRRRTITLKLSELSSKDVKYVESIQAKQPKGTISRFEPVLTKQSEIDLYQKHGIKGFKWKHKEKALPFLLYRPVPSAWKAHKRLPVLVYLHGTGGMGTDNAKVLFKDGHGAAQYFLSEKFQKKNPCFVFIPQIERMSGWYSAHYTDPSQEQIWLHNALRLMSRDNGFDRERIYICGPSMGGHGVYEALAKIPNFYAAGIPIAAVDRGESFNRKNVSSFIWAGLNTGDKTEPVDTLKQFVRDYRKLGGRIRTSIYHTKGHNAWDQLFADEKFVQTLFNQRLK